MIQTTRDKGSDAEEASCMYLTKQGLKLIQKNYHCRHGEIDLIMRQDDTLVFIEVRYRKNNNYGGALESVTPAKKKKVQATVLHYIQSNAIKGDVRIDVMGMAPQSEETSSYNFNWIKNAF